MKRLPFPLLLCCFMILMAGCKNNTKNETVAGNRAPATREVPPNIVYILADDLGYGDIGVYGQKKFDTPNIDKLAAQGMLFTQHYSGSTVCAPSRSALMTGQHTGHTPIRGNKEHRPEGQHPIADEVKTLGEMLQEQGYVTGAFGKWGLGFPGSEGDPLNQGFDRFFGYNCQRFGHNYYPRHMWDDRDSIPLAANEGHKKEVYGPELIHKKTLEFIEENKDKAFFLYVPSIIPHAELAAPEEVLEKYIGKWGEEDPYRGYDSGPDYRNGPYESQKYPRAAFAAMMEVLDRQVGEIVEKIEELGLTENTIIVFTSDNGPHTEGGADPEFFDSNGILRGTKRDLYEGGVRVPMIVKWPGKVAAGTTTDHVSAFWDVFPTFAEIAGGQVPDNTDGISFLHELLSEPTEQEDHEYLYWEFHEQGGKQAIRMGSWKAVQLQVKKGGVPMELYNLAEDPGEQSNVAAQYPDMVAKFNELMNDAREPSEVFEFK